MSVNKNRTMAERRARRKRNTKVKSSKRNFKLIQKRLLFLSKRLINTPIIPIAAGAFALIMLSIWLLWFFTNKNAYEVFVDNKSVGIVALNKKQQVTADSLYATAINRIKQEAGANVEVKETVTGTPVHASKKNIKTVDFVTDEIYKKLTYRVEAAAILVDGIELCVVKNQQSADSIEGNIFDTYIAENAEVVEASFVEDFKVEKKFVEKDDIETDDRAYAKLSVVTQIEQPYTVKSGDNLWSIYTRNNMTEQELLALNPGLTPKIRVGQQITLMADKPLLSVKTIEKETYKTVVKRDTDIRQNPERTKSYRKVEQQGKDGEREVTVHVTKINGVEVDRQEISEQITVPPVNDVVEVGTR